MKKLFLSAIALVLTIVLIGCGELGNSELPREDVEVTQTVTTGGKKETITTTVKTNPRVVATFALEFADIVQELGIEKSGITLFGLAKGNGLDEALNAFSSDVYPNVGTLFLPNYDALDLMMPDLIILGGRASSTYDEIKAKYPNVDILDISNANPYSFETQKQVYNNLGKIFTNLTSDLNAQIEKFETAYNTIKSNFPEKNVLFLLVNGDQISQYGKGSRYGFIFEELGFTPADESGIILEAHGKTVNAEYVSAVNPDVIFIFDRTTATEGSAGSIDNVVNNALIKATNAGKTNSIIVLDSYAWYILPGGIKATETMIKDLNKVFA